MRRIKTDFREQGVPGLRILETDRLALRLMSTDDAEFMLQLLNEPSWLHFIGDRGVRTLDDARVYIINGPVEMYTRHGFGFYIVELKDDGTPIGICGLVKREYLDDVDIGYALLPQYWARGYAYEAASAVLAYGTDELGLKRIVAITSPDNHRSARLLEKLGLRYERIFMPPDSQKQVRLFAIEVKHDVPEATVITDHITREKVKMSSQTLREYVNRHLGSTTIIAALSAVLDAQVTATPLDPTLQARIDEALDAFGLAGVTDGVSQADLKQILAEIRFNMLLDAKLLFHPTRSLAWTHTETEILQAGGDVSAGFADALTQRIVPRLDGLSQQLGSPAGSFLDVGVGVAGLSIAMAQLWPSLNVVGIDSWEPALTLARENVSRAGLADRIQLREQKVEDLSDTNAFDLAWLPSAFIPSKAIPTACERVYRALRPGGWLLFAMANPGTDPITASLVRLRTVLWGGYLMAPDQVEELLSQTGFVDVLKLPSPPGAIVALIAARRMPNQ